jgi:hypothetical protein
MYTVSFFGPKARMVPSLPCRLVVMSAALVVEPDELLPLPYSELELAWLLFLLVELLLLLLLPQPAIRTATSTGVIATTAFALN